MCAALRRERLVRRSRQPPAGSLSGTRPCASEPALSLRNSKDGQCSSMARPQTWTDHLLCARRSLCGANFSKVGFLNKGLSSLFFCLVATCKSALTWLFLPTWEPGTPAHPSHTPPPARMQVETRTACSRTKLRLRPVRNSST